MSDLFSQLYEISTFDEMLYFLQEFDVFTYQQVYDILFFMLKYHTTQKNFNRIFPIIKSRYTDSVQQVLKDVVLQQLGNPQDAGLNEIRSLLSAI